MVGRVLGFFGARVLSVVANDVHYLGTLSLRSEEVVEKCLCGR